MYICPNFLFTFVAIKQNLNNTLEIVSTFCTLELKYRLKSFDFSGNFNLIGVDDWQNKLMLRLEMDFSGRKLRYLGEH